MSDQRMAASEHRIWPGVCLFWVDSSCSAIGASGQEQTVLLTVRKLPFTPPSFWGFADGAVGS